jgi:hypothetical protein
MFTKAIKYKDFNDNEVTENAYFNLSKSELMELEFSQQGGFETFLKRIIETNDNPELFKLFKSIILMSYGRKSDDGKRFVKTQELRDEFEQSPAFGELLMEIIMDPEESMAAFIKGVMPADFVPAEVLAQPKPQLPPPPST